MTPTLDRRQFSQQLVVLAMAALGTVPALAAAPSQDAMIDFDAVYIPPLFLTGSAPKSAEGPMRAKAALARLQSRWPLLRARLEAAWPGDGGWRRTLDTVQGHIDSSTRYAAAGDWTHAHESLEQVRLSLMKARAARGMNYALDRFTAFHETMEQVVVAGSNWDAARLSPTQRSELERLYARARARWRAVETLNLDSRALALTPTREAQLRKAMDDESAALAKLSLVLRGDDAAALLKAAADIKPPFIRAYTAFGLSEGESPRP